jgi:hypothetical protein
MTPSRENWTDKRGGNALDVYREGSRFESEPEQGISCVFLSLFKQIYGQYVDVAVAALNGNISVNNTGLTQRDFK